MSDENKVEQDLARIDKELSDCQRLSEKDLGLVVNARHEDFGEKEASEHSTHEGQNALALIGEPPQGSHPDEWFPRAETWHLERLNWEAEFKQLRETVVGQRDRIQLLMALMDDDEKRVLSEHDGNQVAAPVTPKSESIAEIVVKALAAAINLRTALMTTNYDATTWNKAEAMADDLRSLLGEAVSVLASVSSPAGSSTKEEESGIKDA